MLEKNKYKSFNNLSNEAEISLYFDLILKTYALPKLKAAYSNITSLRFFVQKKQNSYSCVKDFGDPIGLQKLKKHLY